MTVQIDTTAVIKKIRLQQQSSHFAGDPETGYSWLYVVTGTAYGGLYIETDSGEVVGPFVTGTVGTGKVLIGRTLPVGTGTVSWAVPQGFWELRIEGTIRSDRSGSPYDPLYLYINNDTTNGNYRQMRHGAYGESTNVVSGGNTPEVGIVPGGTSVGGSVSHVFIDIFNPNSSWKKQINGLVGYREDNNPIEEALFQYAYEWESTGSITRLDLKLVNGNYLLGSEIRLYGIY